MRTEKSMGWAFALNLAFSLFELMGGLFTGSAAILSDALHDLGDAASIGLAYVFERKSRRPPDESYTYGYGRFSVMGSVVTGLALLLGSLAAFVYGLNRLIRPVAVDYQGVIWLAVFGLCVNGVAAWLTHRGDSLNLKAVSLHMLEDVLGWAAVLAGAALMGLTGLTIIDPILSMGIALFIGLHAAKHLKEAWGILLEKAPAGLNSEALKQRLLTIDGVLDARHIHLWSLDGNSHCAALNVVASGDPQKIKKAIRDTLLVSGVHHVTIEWETEKEHCPEAQCPHE